MGDNIFIIVFGILLTVLGVMNCLGHIETIHWYNRRKITEETRKPYGKTMGIGTNIIGISMLICGIMELIIQSELIYYGLLVGCVIGVGFMLYGQFKYNKGIF